MIRFKLRAILIALIVIGQSFVNNAEAQWTYGTTGLLNMPTADINNNGTFMFGGSYLDKHASSSRWFYDTYNYYVNITFFSCLEFSYNLELHKGVYDDYGCGVKGFWVPSSYGRFCNQDRQFCVKLRLWKEGWLYDWTPQLCIGSDDITSHSWYDTDKQFAIEDARTNGFNNRYYVALTKHFTIQNLGTIGAHLSYLYNVRSDYHLNAPSIGANLRMSLSEKTRFNRIINGFDFMLEAYPANGQGFIYDNSYTKQLGLDRGLHLGIYDLNIGADYTVALMKNKNRLVDRKSGKSNIKDLSQMPLWQRFYDKVTSAFFSNAGNSYSRETAAEIRIYSELYGFWHPSMGLQLVLQL